MEDSIIYFNIIFPYFSICGMNQYNSERLKRLRHYVFRKQASRVVGFAIGGEKNVNYGQIVDRIVIDGNWIPVHRSTVQRASSR